MSPRISFLSISRVALSLALMWEFNCTPSWLRHNRLNNTVASTSMPELAEHYCSCDVANTHKKSPDLLLRRRIIVRSISTFQRQCMNMYMYMYTYVPQNMNACICTCICMCLRMYMYIWHHSWKLHTHLCGPIPHFNAVEWRLVVHCRPFRFLVWPGLAA